MLSQSVENQLMLGLLAVQSGLIDEGELLAAVAAWSRERRTPLADLLVSREALTPEERDAVQALSSRQLARHGTAIQAITASGMESLLEPLLRMMEVGQTTQCAVGQETKERCTSEETVSWSRTDSEVGRYRVLRPHARGGIGLVSVALDTQLNREVALKEIQPQLAADEQSVARFEVEAEITGRLEHPGIVPVHGLGCTPDGRPYYVMRFVKGQSLKEAIAEFHAQPDPGKPADPGAQRLAVRKLLARFIAVCDAVAFAHSRGVIHRDLKPSNILLGPYGETLVVDWGLAKVVGRDLPEPTAEATLRPATASGSSETLAGTAIGTPAYMSPEQAEGRVEELGPATDVYSLGATLYCLLTGRPPLEGEVASVLRRVERGEFPPPRRVRPEVPPELEAIVLRAMATNPRDRYATPRLLAADLEHWLADEPVSAYHDPWFSRIRRWARRHRPVVAAGLALGSAAVVALSVGTVLLGQANRRIQEQRDLARVQRDLARTNFQKAREAVDTYLTRVSQEQLLNQPGLQPLREGLLRSALQYYEGFIQQGADDPQLQRELAGAYERVGEITGEIGTRADAVRYLHNALELYRGILARSPEDPVAQVGLARSLHYSSLWKLFMGDYSGAEESAREAIAALETLRSREPASIELGRLLGRSHDILGGVRNTWGASRRRCLTKRRPCESSRKRFRWTRRIWRRSECWPRPTATLRRL